LSEFGERHSAFAEHDMEALQGWPAMVDGLPDRSFRRKVTLNGRIVTYTRGATGRITLVT